MNGFEALPRRNIPCPLGAAGILRAGTRIYFGRIEPAKAGICERKAS